MNQPLLFVPIVLSVKATLPLLGQIHQSKIRQFKASFKYSLGILFIDFELASNLVQNFSMGIALIIFLF